MWVLLKLVLSVKGNAKWVVKLIIFNVYFNQLNSKPGTDFNCSSGLCFCGGCGERRSGDGEMSRPAYSGEDCIM